jgi:hypothetical protein
MLAYRLREEYTGTVDVHGDGTEIVPVFSGATVTYADGRTFDVREALDAGDGTLVIADTSELAQRLDGLDALELVKLTDEEAAAAEPISGYTGLPVSTLREIAKTRGIAGAGRASRAALETALTEQDERVAAGDARFTATADNPAATVEELVDAAQGDDTTDENESE